MSNVIYIKDHTLVDINDKDGWELKDTLIQAISQYDPEDCEDCDNMRDILQSKFNIKESK